MPLPTPTDEVRLQVTRQVWVDMGGDREGIDDLSNSYLTEVMTSFCLLANTVDTFEEYEAGMRQVANDLETDRETIEWLGATALAVWCPDSAAAEDADRN